MNPVQFIYSNITFAKHQPDYEPLPAWTNGDMVVSCWSLSLRERLMILFSGVLWIRQKTCGRPLQALRPQAPNPFPKMPIISNDSASATGPADSAAIQSGPTGD